MNGSSDSYIANGDFFQEKSSSLFTLKIDFSRFHFLIYFQIQFILFYVEKK